MSHLTRALLLLGLTTLQVSAQNYVVSKPFKLKLRSEDDSYDGRYLGTCHSAAGVDQLCVTEKKPKTTEYNTFTFNTTAGDTTGTGILAWELHGSGFNASQGLAIEPTLTSNVAFVTFIPQGLTPAFTTLGFDSDNRLFLPSPVYDETTFEAGKTPSTTPSKPLRRFYVCWTYYTTFYYQALTWVTEGEPINPTCKCVKVHREYL